MKNNILKTFEDFLKEPLHILKKTIINITGIETADPAQKTISVERTRDGYQINVINSRKAYNLLSSVVYKKQVTELRQLINENKTGKIRNKFIGVKSSANV